MVETAPKKYIYDFHVGMTCDGCSNAIKKLLSSEKYIESFELSVPDQYLKVTGPEGIEQNVIDRLTKWANASKKELAFREKTEV